MVNPSASTRLSRRTVVECRSVRRTDRRPYCPSSIYGNTPPRRSGRSLRRLLNHRGPRPSRPRWKLSGLITSVAPYRLVMATAPAAGILASIDPRDQPAQTHGNSVWSARAVNMVAGHGFTSTTHYYEPQCIITGSQRRNSSLWRDKTPLRLAVSTAYYAVYHALAHRNADLLIGASENRTGVAGMERHLYGARWRPR